MDGMFEALEGWCIPENPDGLHQVLEGLPSYLSDFRDKLRMLAEFLGQEGVVATGDRVEDVAVRVGGAGEAATEAFLEFQGSFWGR